MTVKYESLLDVASEVEELEMKLQKAKVMLESEVDATENYTGYNRAFAQVAGST